MLKGIDPLLGHDSVTGLHPVVEIRTHQNRNLLLGLVFLEHRFKISKHRFLAQGIAIGRGPEHGFGNEIIHRHDRENGLGKARRIGLAMARGLGVALNIPVVGITSLAAIAANETAGDLPRAVAVDARAEEIYFAIHDAAGHELLAPVVVSREKARQLLPNHPAKILGTAADILLGGTGEHRYQRSDAGDLPIAANFAKFASTIQPSGTPPEPLYLRLPDVKPQSTKMSFSTVGPAAAKILAEIHGESFDIAWTETAFSEMLATPGTQAIIMSSHNNPAGFALYRKAADEAEILTLCTHPALRQKGHAKSLVQHMVKLLQNDGVKSLFIEVAVSNHAALALYAAGGFIKSGVRQKYYGHSDGTREDALVMRKGL